MNLSEDKTTEVAVIEREQGPFDAVIARYRRAIDKLTSRHHKHNRFKRLSGNIKAKAYYEETIAKIEAL